MTVTVSWYWHESKPADTLKIWGLMTRDKIQAQLVQPCSSYSVCVCVSAVLLRQQCGSFLNSSHSLELHCIKYCFIWRVCHWHWCLTLLPVLLSPPLLIFSLSLALSLPRPHLPHQPKHQDTFSLAPQRPLTTINPIGHSLHPNGAPTLKPSPVPRTIQAMPWEQRSLYNQWNPREPTAPFTSRPTPPQHTLLLLPTPSRSGVKDGGRQLPSLWMPDAPSAASPLLWNVVFGNGEGHHWELVEIDYWVVRF